MVTENMNGGEFQRLPEGEYKWEVYEVGEAVQKAKSVQRTWKLNTGNGTDVEQVWVYMRPFEYAPILEALGYKKDAKGNMDWEPADIAGKSFTATLGYREYNGKHYAQIGNVRVMSKEESEIPF